MKKKDKKLLLAFLLLFGLLLILAILSVWGRHRKIFDYGAHLRSEERRVGKEC